MNINNCPFCNNELNVFINSKFCYNRNFCSYWFEIRLNNSILIIEFPNKLKLNYKDNTLVIQYNGDIIFNDECLEFNINYIISLFKKYETKIKENLIFQ